MSNEKKYTWHCDICKASGVVIQKYVAAFTPGETAFMEHSRLSPDCNPVKVDARDRNITFCSELKSQVTYA